MRAIVLVLVFSAIAACGAVEAPGVTAPAQLAGEYYAASDNARTLTGDLSIERGGLIFSKGQVLYTRVLQPRRGGDLIARGGDSYAAIALGPAELSVELRRVLDQTEATPAGSLCGAEQPAYVALVYGANAADVAVLVFAGDEPPSADATQTRLCGVYAYVAPDGVRTRQGVLLQ